MENDYAFEMSTSNIRYGPGVTREVGMDLAELGVRRVMIVTDPGLAKTAIVENVVASISALSLLRVASSPWNRDR